MVAVIEGWPLQRVFKSTIRMKSGLELWPLYRPMAAIQGRPLSEVPLYIHNLHAQLHATPYFFCRCTQSCDSWKLEEFSKFDIYRITVAS